MYKRALKDYRKSGYDGNNTWTGFCAYLANTYHIAHIYDSLHTLFPELDDMAKLDPSYISGDFGYWFEVGHKAPRIRTLQAAIKLLESNK